MSRYDMTYFMTMPLKIGHKLIAKAYIETEKQKAWDLWVARHSADSFQPFSKFFESQKGDTENEIEKISTFEMLNMAGDIESKISQGKYKEVQM